MYDVLIVGAGPAGVSCALWLKQLGFRPILIEKNACCGGLQLQNPFTNTWIATSHAVHGPSVARAMQDNVNSHGIDARFNATAVSAIKQNDFFEVILADKTILKGRVLVLAGGVVPKTNGLIGRAGLLLGPGPTVANRSFLNAKVAILGGGDSAFENYGFVKERGASSVTLFARSLRARMDMLNTVPTEDVVVGDYVFNPDELTVDNEKFDQVLVLYGYEAKKSSLLGLEIALDARGFVVTDASCVTTMPRVYAIGELAQRAHPCCVTAMSDGIVAAKDIQRQLETTAASKYIGMARRVMNIVRTSTP